MVENGHRPSFGFENHVEGLVVGLDEAGMGCWAGDVFAAAAYVPETVPAHFLQHIHDSKKLTSQKRQDLLDGYPAVGIQIAVASASLVEIDQLNIRGAAWKAMERAFAALALEAELALVDGTMTPVLPCRVQPIIKGDQQSYSIAAASIAAKVSRDRYMAELDKLHPEYRWVKNAGYGTKAHQMALDQYGVSAYHRRSYRPIQALLKKEG
jgi:ribonuclease HII